MGCSKSFSATKGVLGQPGLCGVLYQTNREVFSIYELLSERIMIVLFLFFKFIFFSNFMLQEFWNIYDNLHNESINYE